MYLVPPHFIMSSVPLSPLYCAAHGVVCPIVSSSERACERSVYKEQTRFGVEEKVVVPGQIFMLEA